MSSIRGGLTTGNPVAAPLAAVILAANFVSGVDEAEGYEPDAVWRQIAGAEAGAAPATL